jgi:hypothetical protein
MQALFDTQAYTGVPLHTRRLPGRHAGPQSRHAAGAALRGLPGRAWPRWRLLQLACAAQTAQCLQCSVGVQVRPRHWGGGGVDYPV